MVSAVVLLSIAAVWCGLGWLFNWIDHKHWYAKYVESREQRSKDIEREQGWIQKWHDEKEAAAKYHKLMNEQGKANAAFVTKIMEAKEQLEHGNAALQLKLDSKTNELQAVQKAVNE